GRCRHGEYNAARPGTEQRASTNPIAVTRQVLFGDRQFCSARDRECRDVGPDPRHTACRPPPIMPNRRVALFVFIAALTVSVRPAPAQINGAEAAERGFQALQRGDGDTAAAMFRIALAAHPRDAALLFGAGVAAHLQGREGDASTALKQALQLEPRLTQASAFLGEILHAEGDLDQAIATYEAALKHAPGNMEMRSRLEMWRREASVHSGLESLVDGRFGFRFQGPVEEQLAARARAVLTAAFSRIGGALGAYPSNSITVIMYSDQQFRDITGAPEWSGGGFDGQIRLPV